MLPAQFTARVAAQSRGHPISHMHMVFLLLTTYLWRLFGHLCSSATPETDTHTHTHTHTRFQNPATLHTEICGIFSAKMRKLSEIVFPTWTWTSNTAKQRARKCWKEPQVNFLIFQEGFGDPKERRRRCAERWLSKTQKTLIPISVFFSFPVLFWCRFYRRFFRSDKGIWGLKKAQFLMKKTV